MIQEEDSKKKEEMNHATSLARRLAQPSLIILIIRCPFISDCPYAYELINCALVPITVVASIRTQAPEESKHTWYH